eukprot:m.276650 g.276650  ORF g.276650 m.276650 type:complete len:415 (-) comp22866_c0_seq11:5748-6992(-)
MRGQCEFGHFCIHQANLSIRNICFVLAAKFGQVSAKKIKLELLPWVQTVVERRIYTRMFIEVVCNVKPPPVGCGVFVINQIHRALLPIVNNIFAQQIIVRGDNRRVKLFNFFSQLLQLNQQVWHAQVLQLLGPVFFRKTGGNPGQPFLNGDKQLRLCVCIQWDFVQLRNLPRQQRVEGRILHRLLFTGFAFKVAVHVAVGKGGVQFGAEAVCMQSAEVCEFALAVDQRLGLLAVDAHQRRFCATTAGLRMCAFHNNVGDAVRAAAHCHVLPLPPWLDSQHDCQRLFFRLAFGQAQRHVGKVGHSRPFCLSHVLSFFLSTRHEKKKKKKNKTASDTEVHGVGVHFLQQLTLVCAWVCFVALISSRRKKGGRRDARGSGEAGAFYAFLFAGFQKCFMRAVSLFFSSPSTSLQWLTS